MLNVANFLITSLRAAIGSGDTSLPLAVGTSSLFNYMAPGDTVYLTIKDRTAREVVLFTKGGALANDNLTPVTRGQDGTIARAFPAGSCVQAEWTIAQLTQFAQAIAEMVVTLAPPFNTTIVTLAPPVGAPAPGVLFAIDTTVPALYYWTGVAWIQLTNGGTPITPTDFGSGIPPPGPATPGIVYVDGTGMVYILIGAVWTPVLTELWPAGPGSPPLVQPGYEMQFDAQGRLVSINDVLESLSRTAALAVPQVIPVIGAVAPLNITVNSGQFGTVLTPQGTNAIRVTVPAGKTAYVRFLANCSVVPAAPLAAAEVTQLSIKKTDGTFILPTPALATDDPALTQFAPAGATATQFFNASSPAIPFPTGVYDIALFMGSQGVGTYNLNNSPAYGGATLYAELLAVR